MGRIGPLVGLLVAGMRPGVLMVVPMVVVGELVSVVRLNLAELDLEVPVAVLASFLPVVVQLVLLVVVLPVPSLVVLVVEEELVPRLVCPFSSLVLLFSFLSAVRAPFLSSLEVVR